MTLSATRTLAESIARRNCQYLRVVGVFSQRGSTVVEVLLDDDACPAGTCRLMLSVDRDAPETFAVALQAAMLRNICSGGTPPRAN